MTPDWTDWAFLFLRAVIALAATYMGVNLLAAFIRNHFLHRPKRWLVGWQGLFFGAVGADATVRLWSRATFISTATTVDVTNWAYWSTGVLMAVGMLGMLFTWLRWPDSRTVGQSAKKHDDDCIKVGGTD